jgi:hypothetical protein
MDEGSCTVTLVVAKIGDKERQGEMKIRRRETEGLISFYEAVFALRWPVAEHYRVWDGLLYADGGYKYTSTKPLAESDLFLSFARLGARGNPSERTIVDWVTEHGLLTRGQAGQGNEDDLGAPITLEEFRAEVRDAYSALTLLEALRGQDVPRIRARIDRERSINPKPGELNSSGHVLVDGVAIPWVVDANQELSDDNVLHIGEVALKYFVDWELDRGVRLRLSVVRDYKSPRPLYHGSRPRLVPYCRDLLGALWLQCGLLVEDSRPWRNCEVCGGLFLATQINKVICGPTCRKRKSRNRG